MTRRCGAALSSDGRTLACACIGSGNPIGLWDLATGQKIGELVGHSAQANTVSFSPDGRTIASGGRDNTVRLWDFASRKAIRTLAGHTGSVRTVVFSPDGRRLASAGWDTTVRIWDVDTGQTIDSLQGPALFGSRLAYSPDGRTLAYSDGGGFVRIYDVVTKQEVLSLSGRHGPLNDLVFRPDGRQLAAAADDGTVLVWDAEPITPELRVIARHAASSNFWPPRSCRPRKPPPASAAIRPSAMRSGLAPVAAGAGSQPIAGRPPSKARRESMTNMSGSVTILRSTAQPGSRVRCPRARVRTGRAGDFPRRRSRRERRGPAGGRAGGGMAGEVLDSGGRIVNSKHLASSVAGLVILVAIVPAAPGMFIRVEVEKVPVERLIANLEATLEKKPGDVRALVNLARVHAMAYALKTDTAPMAKGHEDWGPWFGHLAKIVPFSAVVKTDDPARQKGAKVHLVKAINRFREAAARAGQPGGSAGLCVDRRPGRRKDEAIRQYRSLIEDAWKKEERQNSFPMHGETVVTEAAGYLIPLLDREKDKQEIATLTKRVAQLREKPRWVTPIAVPLRDGMEARDLENRNASVAFDADGSGLKRRWTWVSDGAGWLVYDPKGRGEITSSLQLFGNVTFWLFWENGYDALASLDDDGDGMLTGDELKGLAIWHDAGQAGVCEPGEVKPLAGYGIVAVSCRFERDRRHPDQIAFSSKGVTFKHGNTRPTFDLVLHAADPAGRSRADEGSASPTSRTSTREP